MRKTPISLVIITKNEEARIAFCIRSVDFADDILVLDSESQDRTREIATQMGARVFNEAFRGFRDQKQRAADLAKHDWVLSLDADEALSPQLAEEIKNLDLSNAEASAFAIPRMSYHLGRWIKAGGWYPDRQIRLFNRKTSRWEKGAVHEKISSPNIVRLKSPILHWVFEDLSDQVQTNNKYSSLGAEDLRTRGKNFSLFMLLTKPISKFVECYILKRGFIDGMPGFIIAVSAAYSMFLKFAKLWELEKLKK